MGLVIVLAERNELLADDMSAGVGDIFLDGAV